MCKERNVLVATFSRLLLTKIGQWFISLRSKRSVGDGEQVKFWSRENCVESKKLNGLGVIARFFCPRSNCKERMRKKALSTRTLVAQASDLLSTSAKIVSSDTHILAPGGSYFLMYTASVLKLVRC